jgi:hypothetical protein
MSWIQHRLGRTMAQEAGFSIALAAQWLKKSAPKLRNKRQVVMRPDYRIILARFWLQLWPCASAVVRILCCWSGLLQTALAMQFSNDVI